MSKERLEQMEHDYQNAFPIDIDWLLDYAKERAERVEYLKKVLGFYADKDNYVESESE